MVVPAGQPVADLLLHLLALLAVLETFQQLGSTALVGPRRDDAGQVVAAARVRIDVGLHVDAALAGRLDQRDHFNHAAPVLLVRNLEVDDVNGDVGPLADGDSLLDRREDFGPFVADVG